MTLRLRVSLAAAVVAVASAALPALTNAADPIVFARYEGIGSNGSSLPGSGLFASDDSGGTPRLITSGQTYGFNQQPPTDPSLSADGQTVVYRNACPPGIYG